MAVQIGDRDVEIPSLCANVRAWCAHNQNSVTQVTALSLAGASKA
jgi:hypothetical protein